MNKLTTNVLLKDLKFPEAPRWHDDRLWFSDMEDRKVVSANVKGDIETVFKVPNRPSGLGWLPNGRLLVVSMEDRKLFELESGALKEFADLGRLATYPLNDMVISKQDVHILEILDLILLIINHLFLLRLLWSLLREKLKLWLKTCHFQTAWLLHPMVKQLLSQKPFQLD